jgi:hypothetical protein
VQEATDRTDGLALAVMAAPKAEAAQESTRKSRPASIDKSDLPHPEPRRVRDRDHVRFVTKQPCLICGGADRQIPIICGSRSSAPLVARSATNLPCRYAAAIIARPIALVMKPHGGKMRALTQRSLPARSG